MARTSQSDSSKVQRFVRTRDENGDGSAGIEQLQERIAELEEENARLRASAGAFADLAERLNELLRPED